jgi:hypothetical protein
VNLRLRFCSVILSAALLAAAAPSQDHTAEFRARFDKETDPVRKAKLLSPLSDAEFHQIQTLLAAENLTQASAIAGQMADEAEEALKALDAKGRDPEKNPQGYKQAEISVRSSLRRINDVLVGLPADDQKPFMDARNRLDEVDRKLIRDLFPRQPDAEPAPAAPKS